MVRKCRGIAEAAVVEMAAQVGVRTRARAALAMAAPTSGTASKRRKVSSPLKFSPSPPNAELSSQSYVVIAQREESVALRSTSHPSSGEAPASCCSSNGSSELAKEAIEFVDLEEEGGEVERSIHYCSRERREAMPWSQVRAEPGMLESTERPSTTEEADSGHGRMATRKPTGSELEEFFAGAEKEIQKRFAEKYNYDIGKDEPLEDGRYEWVRIKKTIQ